MKPVFAYPLLLAAMLCLVRPTSAQTPTQAPPAASDDKAALIQQLLTITHARQNADEYLPIFLSTEQRTLAEFTPRQIAMDPELTPAQRALMLKNVGAIEAHALAHYRQLLTQQMDVGAVITDIHARLYDKYYTADDLRSMIAFYQTPVGQKLVAFKPQIDADAARMTQTALMSKVETITEQVLHQERLDWERAAKPAVPAHGVSPLT